ncbi:hypothetical protein BJV77DRAFT_959395 [Russula vinacea]|nr:hypothetical protein BJV77DRAFT_959395 [Russula vinacea]
MHAFTILRTTVLPHHGIRITSLEVAAGVLIANFLRLFRSAYNLAQRRSPYDMRGRNCQCHPGTRTRHINYIWEWVRSSEQPALCWLNLNGVAGLHHPRTRRNSARKRRWCGFAHSGYQKVSTLEVNLEESYPKSPNTVLHEAVDDSDIADSAIQALLENLVSPRENGAHQACHQVGLSIQTKIHTTQLGSRCLSLMGSLSEDMFKMASLWDFNTSAFIM